ncbi:MAG TPA: divergent polysaccharide deacetylase family protein, partial [Paenibacillus sp.]
MKLTRWGSAAILSLVVLFVSDSSVSYAIGGFEDSPANTASTVEYMTTVTEEKRLAVIIDDFGNAMKGTDEILGLPVKLTVAVMPFLRTSEQDARKAHEKGHDVIIHLPMEPKQGKPEWLGPGAIL